MRIALCLSGHMRAWGIRSEAALAWRRAASEHSLDIFIHTWDCIGNRNNSVEIIGPLENKMLVSDEPLALGNVLRDWMPTRYICESQSPMFESMLQRAKVWNQRRDDYIRATNDTKIVVNRYLSNLYMWYSWKQSNWIRIAHEQEQGIQYDCVWRSRPDLFPHAELPFSTEAITTPKWGNDPEGLHDWWATGTPEHINVLSSLYDHLDELWQETLVLGPAHYEPTLNPHKLPWRLLHIKKIPMVKANDVFGHIER